MDMTIDTAIQNYLGTIKSTRSENTARTYQNAMNVFRKVLVHHPLDPETTLISEIPEEAIVWLAASLKDHSPNTERLYVSAAAGFYEYLAAENLASINLPRIRLLVHQRTRKPGQRLPQFPKDSINNIINYMINMNIIAEDDNERLRLLRDRAFLITLADTGLRVHEACGLRRGDIDWNEGHAIIIGKGNRQAMVRFSTRSMDTIKEYLKARSTRDGASGKALSSQPLFARHDRGAGKKIKPMTTTTGRNIVAEWVEKILGVDAVGTITPHSFRHYFVTTVLQASGNLKLAQELARHKNIAVTQRYAHLSDDELDRGYYDIFESK
jgi:site-specific recombinase XerD